jgi:glutathione S-transferase
MTISLNFPRLGSADWIDGGFSAGELMVSVLLRLKSSGITGKPPTG